MSENRWICVAGVCLSVFCAATPAQAQSSFNDPAGRYSVRVPQGWTATALNRDAVQLSVPGCYATVMVLPNDDPAAAIEAIARQTSGQWRGFAEARRGDMRMAGLAGKYVTYSGANPRGVDSYLEMMAVHRGASTYLLMVSVPKTQYNAVKGALDTIEQSLTVNAAPPAAPTASAAPAPAGAASPRATAPTGKGGDYYRMKKVSVIDQHGFEKPLPALSLLVPTDWQFQGDTKYVPTFGGCHENTVQVSFHANSPDGRVAVEMFPSYVWQWADDPGAVQLMQTSARQSAQFGGKPCETLPAMSAGDYLRRMVIPQARPNARVVAVEPMADVLQQTQEQARQYEQTAIQMGMRMRIRADAARALVEYSLNGQKVEEWLTAVTYAAGVPGPSYNMRTGQMGQTTYYTCGAYFLMAMRAPQGELASREKFFTILRSTVRPEPEWSARVAQVLRNMQAADTKGAADRSAIMAQNGRDISNIINQTYENRSKSQERSAEQFDQYIRGVATYKNPSTGETFELSNQYAHAWVGGNNEYVLSDSASFNPNAVLNGHWTEAVPVK